MRNRKRIHLLDNLRGLAVLCMVFFHAFYTMGYLFDFIIGVTLYEFFAPAEPFFASLFVLLCGLSCRLSRSNVKRGLLLVAAAIGVSLVTIFFMPEQAIYFGILHLLGVCILLFVLFRKALDKIPPWIGIFICAVLFTLSWRMYLGYIGIKGLFVWHLPQVLTSQTFLFPIGIAHPSFASADYFPLFPWLFMFLAGSFLGVSAAANRLPRWTYRNVCPPLSLISRYAFLIYIVHQPVIYGLFWLIQRSLLIFNG